MRLLDIEGSDEELRVTRAYLNNVEAHAHSFALFVENDAIFIQNARLPVDNRPRLGQFPYSGPRASHRLLT